jgi:acyl dehydratase
MEDALMSEITLDKYKAMVGQEIGVSRWFEVAQARIDSFADITEDHQFIHVDPERAKATPFGGTVAHGFLTMSLLAPMAFDAQPTLAGTVMPQCRQRTNAPATTIATPVFTPGPLSSPATVLAVNPARCLQTTAQRLERSAAAGLEAPSRSPHAALDSPHRRRNGCSRSRCRLVRWQRPGRHPDQEKRWCEPAQFTSRLWPQCVV